MGRDGNKEKKEGEGYRERNVDGWREGVLCRWPVGVYRYTCTANFSLKKGFLS